MSQVTSQGYSPREGVVINQFSYRDVLQAKAHVGHIDVLSALAKRLGYDYILWDDRVYAIVGGNPVDTCITADFVY